MALLVAAVAGKIVGGGLPPGGAGIGRGSRRQRKTERCGEPPRIDVAGVAGRWPRYRDKNQHPGVGNGKWKNMEANKKIRNAAPTKATLGGGRGGEGNHYANAGAVYAGEEVMLPFYAVMHGCRTFH